MRVPRCLEVARKEGKAEGGEEEMVSGLSGVGWRMGRGSSLPNLYCSPNNRPVNWETRCQRKE